MDEKREFAKRLRKALKLGPRKIDTPSELAAQFDLLGKPVTAQAAQKWLAGTATPTPDKIAALAKWLDVSEKWLRFGVTDEIQPPRRPVALREPHQPSASEWTFIERLRRMPEARRRLVEELVEQLSLDSEIWKRP